MNHDIGVYNAHNKNSSIVEDISETCFSLIYEACFLFLNLGILLPLFQIQAEIESSFRIKHFYSRINYHIEPRMVYYI